MDFLIIDGIADKNTDDRQSSSWVEYRHQQWRLFWGSLRWRLAFAWPRHCHASQTDNYRRALLDMSSFPESSGRQVTFAEFRRCGLRDPADKERGRARGLVNGALDFPLPFAALVLPGAGAQPCPKVHASTSLIAQAVRNTSGKQPSRSFLVDFCCILLEPSPRARKRPEAKLRFCGHVRIFSSDKSSSSKSPELSVRPEAL